MTKRKRKPETEQPPQDAQPEPALPSADELTRLFVLGLRLRDTPLPIVAERLGVGVGELMHRWPVECAIDSGLALACVEAKAFEQALGTKKGYERQTWLAHRDNERWSFQLPTQQFTVVATNAQINAQLPQDESSIALARRVLEHAGQRVEHALPEGAEADFGMEASDD